MGRRSRLAGALVALALVGACATDPAPGEDAEPATAGPTSSADATSEPAEPTEPADPPSSTPPTQDPLVKEVEEQLREEGLDGVDEQILGSDISWPQCPAGMGIPQKRSSGSPGPLPEARYVILGLTNGPGFYPNPCLAEQVALVRDGGLQAAAYAVASYPEADDLVRYASSGPFDGDDRLGALSNTGYQQARFNLRTMRGAGLLTPIVWIDVEPVPDFAWSTDLAANAAVVRGLARGYTDAGLRIGVYSTPLLWDGVVGDLALGLPEWRAAGQTSRAEALSRCGEDWVIQGGPAVLGQWVEDDRDQNITCPGVSVEMERWFHQY